MRCRCLFAALLATLASTEIAFAQALPEAPAPATPPPSDGVLAVDVEPGAGGLDAGRLRDAIAREAAVRVTDAASRDGPRLVVRGDGARGLTFRLVGTGDHDAERTIELPDGSESKQLSVAGLVAASLLEDDAAELLARLRAEMKKTEPPAPTPVVKPRPPARELPPCETADPKLRRVFGADFAPGVGTSAFEPPGTVRRISLEFLGGGASGVAGIEFSPLFSFNRGFVCGVQVSGFGSWTLGLVRGVAFSGGIGWADSVHGVAFHGLLSITKNTVRGFQFGSVDIAREVQGMQLGAVNIARDVQGLQFGVVNVAGDVHGLQLAPVNVARTSDASIGLVSIVTNGRTNLQAFATTNAVTSVAVQHGGRIMHNFYGASLSADGKSGAAGGPLFGIGFHAREDAHWFLDLDFLAHLLFGSSGSGKPQSLYEARIVAGIRLAPAFAIYAGPAFDALMVHTGQQPHALDGLVLKNTTATNDGTFHFSPALVAGVRGF